MVLYSEFVQLRGESDIAFIKRITSSPPVEHKKNNTNTTQKVVGKYQSIEEWDAERNDKGELTWEEKAQFDGQRYGNQVRQNDILSKHLKF